MLVSGSDFSDGSENESQDSSDQNFLASAKKHQFWEFQSQVRFTSWRDVNIESLGHDARSSYVEKFWLPFLGPSTVFLARRLTEMLENEQYGFSIDLQELSVMLGLGPNTNKQSSIQKTLNRLLIFELARIMPSKAVSVRLKLPPLPQRYVNRLPQMMQDLHEKETQEGSENALAAAKTRARSLALALSKLGHERSAIEKQLISWRFHPSICYETLKWMDTVATQDTKDDQDGDGPDEITPPKLQP